MLDATPTPAPTTPGGVDSPARQWRLPQRARLSLSLGSLAVLVVVVAQWARSFYSDTHSIAGRYDFSTYYAAAYALRHNIHADIYSQAVLTEAGAAGHVMVQPPLAYTYPPLFAILLSPLTNLSFRVLSKLWLFGNAALWLAITALLAREIARLLRPALARPATSGPAVESSATGPRPPTPSLRAGGWSFLLGPAGRMPGLPIRELFDDPLPLFALALAAWLCLTFAPAHQTLLTGQINFLVLAPLVLVPALLRNGHDRWAGVAIAVAAILKFTPALLIVYLLLRRRWRAAGAAVVVLVGLFVLSALVVGPGVAAASIGQALHVGAGDAGLGHNQALFAPLLLYVSLHAPALFAAVNLLTHLALVLIALALGYLMWCLPMSGVQQRESSSQPTATATARRFTASDAASYGLALCGLLLLSPTAWVHHYVWLLPAAAIALGLAGAQLAGTLGTRQFQRAVVALGAIALAGAALGVSLPYDWDTNPHPAITHAGLLAWPLALLLRPLATLVLAGMFVLLARSPARAEHPADAG